MRRGHRASRRARTEGWAAAREHRGQL